MEILYMMYGLENNFCPAGWQRAQALLCDPYCPELFAALLGKGQPKSFRRVQDKAFPK